jgi:hypothetical protein
MTIKLTNPKHLAIIAAIATAIFAVGYYLSPAKVETKTVTIEVEKIVEKVVFKENKTENKNTDTVIIETILPDGSKRTETRIVDRGTITSDIISSLQSEVTKYKEQMREKTVEYGYPSVSLAALVYRNPENIANPEFGIAVSKRIVGPFTAGLFGLQNKTIGLSLGVTFK